MVSYRTHATRGQPVYGAQSASAVRTGVSPTIAPLNSSLAGDATRPVACLSLRLGSAAGLVSRR